MSVLSRIDRHERLLNKMADTNGADLDEAMQAGRLTPEAYRSSVFACMGCANPGDCESILAEERPGVPGYCRNARLIEALQP